MGEPEDGCGYISDRCRETDRNNPAGGRTTHQAAKYLGISQATLYRLVDEGLLPAYRSGRVFRFRTSDLDDYLESVRVRPGHLTHLRSDAVGRAAKAARNPEGGGSART